MFEGVLKKMVTDYQTPIDYYQLFEKQFIHLNQCIGKKIELIHTGYQCFGKACVNSKVEKPIFRMGHCFDCFNSSPLTGDWIYFPEKSKAHKNEEDRNLEIEKHYQLQSHVVYLASTNKIKVGVTRRENIPYRWIDQGAHEVVEILEMPNRYLAGLAEVNLKNHFASSTSWIKMLKRDHTKVDWDLEKEKAIAVLSDDLKQYVIKEKPTPLSFRYPLENPPKKPQSLKLTSIGTSIKGTLSGIIGQYLVFTHDKVFNIRNHEGYKVKISIS